MWIGLFFFLFFVLSLIFWFIAHRFGRKGYLILGSLLGAFLIASFLFSIAGFSPPLEIAVRDETGKSVPNAIVFAGWWRVYLEDSEGPAPANILKVFRTDANGKVRVPGRVVFKVLGFLGRYKELHISVGQPDHISQDFRVDPLGWPMICKKDLVVLLKTQTSVLRNSPPKDLTANLELSLFNFNVLAAYRYFGISLDEEGVFERWNQAAEESPGAYRKTLIDDLHRSEQWYRKLVDKTAILWIVAD